MIRRVPRCLLALVSSLLVLALAGGALWAQQPKTEKLTLTLSTETQLLPFKIPDMPGMPKMPKPGEPQRVISGEAAYPTAAVEPIFVTVPADLKLAQNKLVLRVPKPGQGPGVPTPGQPGQPPQGKMQWSSKLYWHPDTAEGPLTQSVTIDLSQAGPMMGPGGGMAQAMGRIAADMEKTATGSENELPENVVGSGQYVLNTGGTATLDGFLPPVKVTQPEALAEVKLADGFEVEWEPVAGARGYILHAMAMVGQMGQMNNMTIISWVSTLKEPPERVRQDYEQATTIADDLRDGILLSPEATSCKVPPGVFTEEPFMFVLTVTAVGNDFYSDAGGITVRGRIRAKWTSMKMGMMPMMPGMGQQ
jgi:hypothetical protein